MIPQIGFVELLVLGVIALIVVGPKDLPAMLRKLGAMTARARGMASDFRGAFDDMGREVELDELKKEIEAIKQANPVQNIKDELQTIGKDVGEASTIEIEDDGRKVKNTKKGKAGDEPE